MLDTLRTLYYRITMDRPAIIWLLAALFIAASAWFAQDFKLDASADALILENDADLKYYRGIRARYGSDDFLVVTYSPKADLFSDETLADLRALSDELSALERVESVTSILTVPLVDSPRMSLSEIQKGIRTLESEDTDRELARREFSESPLYRNLLTSPDADTTALLVYFKHDEHYQSLLKRRSELREKEFTGQITEEERQELEQVVSEFKQYTAQLQNQQQEDIAAVRAILDRYRDRADIHLGGIPMITSDMIDFIRSDIKVFGIGVSLFLITLLAVSFKRPRWVLVPMFICLVTVVGMVGYLGLVEWKVTVVSSNFISLLLIITLSLTVHLVVRHQELHAEEPNSEQYYMVKETVRSKVAPSFYTALTTMVAFGSLIISGIRPVIDFGWMMVFGVGLAFVLTFLLFPAATVLLPVHKPIFRQHDATATITRALANLIERNSNATLLVYAVLVAMSIIGIGRLTVENRFIDYFKESTEIHQGMVLIDKKLGGTTPLDVVLDPTQEFLASLHSGDSPQEEATQEPAASGTDQTADEAPKDQTVAEEDDPYAGELDGDILDDEFADDEFSGDAGISGDSYWFNTFALEEVDRIHAYLESLPETGKVLSLSTSMSMMTTLNDGKPLDNMTLSVMYKRLPDDVKQTLFTPYMSEDGNQVRFSIRVIDSDPNLLRDALLKKIRHDLIHKLGLEEQQVHLSGMLVLYNNVLQSLFKSQILTLSVVFLAIMFMLLILFHSWKLALIGTIPTIVAAGLILGLMGWLGIPLDIMTITIAAITIGIGVDDTIHYVHRFKEELDVDGNYWAAVHRSHGTVGRALYYTSVIITLGFSILMLSNFIPSIYFGILTGIAMVVALIANLTLLPLLIVKFRPMGDGAGA